MPVPVEYHLPVGILNAVWVVCARGTALGIVVLRSSVDVVERLGIIHRQLVELSHRQIGDKTPGPGQIEGFIKPAIGSDHQIIRIVLFEGDRMVIRMLVLLAHSVECLSSIVGYLHPHIDQIQSTLLMGRCIEFLIIMRPSGSGNRRRTLFPAVAAVGGTKHTSCAPIQFDGRIDHIRVLWRECNPHLPHLG